jgi:hypothetical protein
VRHGSLLFQPHSSNNSELVQSSIWRANSYHYRVFI